MEFIEKFEYINEDFIVSSYFSDKVDVLKENIISKLENYFQYTNMCIKVEEKLLINQSIVIPTLALINNNVIPEIIIEIASVSYSNECARKLKLYQKSRVKEYIIIDIKNKEILCYFLKNNVFKLSCDNTYNSKLYRDLSLNIREIFN